LCSTGLVECSKNRCGKVQQARCGKHAAVTTGTM
jgi:hypothetical protein